jgi:hypothetical protein
MFLTEGLVDVYLWLLELGTFVPETQSFMHHFFRSHYGDLGADNKPMLINCSSINTDKNKWHEEKV